MGFRQFLEGRGGMMTAATILFCGVAAAVYMFWPDTADSLTADVNAQVWIDTDGNVFRRTLKPFDTSEVTGPNGQPAFRAELCYWTRDGKVKTDATPVLLNSNVGKPEPTFCPDCGRLVRPLNPAPLPDLSDAEQQMPPTQAQYEARGSR